MIGSGLKKLAKENAMSLSKGVAYGSLKGYTATFFEGAGFKSVVFTVYFRDQAQREALGKAAGQRDIVKDFSVTALNIGEREIGVVFEDKKGTMDKIRAFLDWFVPLMSSHMVGGSSVCPHCGGMLSGGNWILLDGAAYHVHEACARSLDGQVERENRDRKQGRKGSYLTGALGAFAGAALGAVAWAIVLRLGYFVAVLGLLIAFLAGKGYSLCKGRRGKGMVVIMVLAILAGVIFGTFLGYDEILDGYRRLGESLGLEGWDAISYALDECSGELMRSVLTGLLFAGLGTFGFLKKLGAEVSDRKKTVPLPAPGEKK